MRHGTRNPMDREWAIAKLIVDCLDKHGNIKDNEQVTINASGIVANNIPLGDWEITVRRK